jgi:threonine dehydrogenase-like Zn-dependent dehydrogenase
LARSFWIAAKEKGELRDTTLGALAPDHVRVRMIVSGISRGTERLVWQGRVPASEHARMRAPFQDGEFPFPVKYGYCAVGRIVEGANTGARVFALHPHQDEFDVPANTTIPLPDDVPDTAAPLAAHLETAINALWDHPVRVGDRVAAIGLGAVGLCLANLVRRVPGVDLICVDPSPMAQARAKALGLRVEDVAEDRDLVFHTSATAGGLRAAIDAAGFEATIVELSWYGEGSVAAPLGGAFHAKRLTLAASQVGHVAQARRATRPHRARLELALRLLADPAYRLNLGAPIPFAELPARYAEALGDHPSPLPLIGYGQE